MSRVVALTTSWPRFPGDIAGSFVYGWARALAARGHYITVLCPATSKSTTQYQSRDSEDLTARGACATNIGGLSVRRVPYLGAKSLFYGAGAPENLANSLRPWVEILPFGMTFYRAALAETRGADLIVGHWVLPMGFLAAHVGRSLNVPAAAIAHSGDVHLLSQMPLALRPLTRHLLRSVKLACVSEHQRPTLTDTAGDAEVLPMGVDEELFDATRDRAAARQRLGLSGLVALYMGRLVPIKGVDLLLQASRGLPLTLLLAGDGPSREALVEQARTLGVSTRFLGAISGQARRDAFAAADLFVLPSRVMPNGRSEGMPVALLEAAAAGLPLLASAAGGIPSRLTHQVNGLLFSPGDVPSLRQQLSRLISAPTLRAQLAKTARSAVEPLRWNTVAAGYERLFWR